MGFFFVKPSQADNAGGAQPGSQFSWVRALMAFALLVILFLVGVYCAHDDKLQDWSAMFLHSSEILLGGLVGMIIGEGASKS